MSGKYSNLDRSLLCAAALVCALLFQGCSSKGSPKQSEPYKERRFFGVSFRQLAPDPVYNRLRLAYLPEPLPPYDLPRTSDASLSPIFHLELKKTTLEQAARVLANMARYTSYTSSVIASRKIEFNGLGTLDELADQLSETTGINVVVDHSNREVRFLANGRPTSSAPASENHSAADAAALTTHSVPGGTTIGGIEASPLSPDKFSDETLERLGSSKAKGQAR